MPDTTAPPTAAAQTIPAHGATARQNLTIAALGVVYGDIGTSPLYAIKQCFHDGTAVTTPRVCRGLSLCVGARTIVVTGKYVIVRMRADNRGEGGIFALTVLALRATTGRKNRWIMFAGLIGGSLFFGDSVLTPAISVISAVEGLEVKAPDLQPFVLPLTVILLVALFVAQRRGTGRVGGFFGPVIIVWCTTLGLWGLAEIVRQPGILEAVNPLYGIELILSDPGSGFILLGSVVLAVTGAEALYADMGHFGRPPIRRGWLRFVFPCLLLNYFGQGALLLANPDALQNPFYRLAPDWAVYPLVVLASAATVIASQAVISGAFSLTRQAVQLGYLPRMQVQHTSEHEMGQVFVPEVNTILLLAVVATVIGFQSSNALGSAYGIAVTGTMPVDTILGFTYLSLGAKWPLWLLIPLFGLFAIVDLSFFGANLLKVAEGGWFPIVVASFAFAVMGTWGRGRRRLAEQRARDAMPLGLFVGHRNPPTPVRARPLPRRAAAFAWRDRVFIFLADLALDGTEFFRLPPNRVVELGGQVEICPSPLADRTASIAAQHLPWRGAGVLGVIDDNDAVNDDRGARPGRIAVRIGIGRLVTKIGRIEDGDIGPISLGEQAAVVQFQGARRAAGHLLDRLV